MRGVKLVVRWCSCWDTISIQRYLSLLKSCRRWRAINTRWYMYVLYVYIFVVCLLLAVVRFSSWQTYVLLIHRHETRLNFSSSALLLLLLCLFFPFSLSFFFVVFVLFVALEKLDFWASRCQAAVLFYTLYKWKVEYLAELCLRTFWFNFKNV